MLIEFSGKQAIVTGAGGGIGRRIAERFHDDGARVYAVDVQAPAYPVAASDRWIETQLDLADRPAAAAWVAGIEATSGAPIDILVNCAGGWVGQVPESVDTVSDEAWDLIVEANLGTAFTMIRAVLPGMRRQRYGRIINITSGAGNRASNNNIAAYTAAKHGMTGLTRQVAKDVARDGITVNAIGPGLVDSSDEVRRNWDLVPPERQQAVLDAIWIGRRGIPDDIASSVLFFASDFADWVTAQEFYVNGGRP